MLTPCTAAQPTGAVITPAGRYWLISHGDNIEVLDRYGDEAITLRGEEVTVDGLDAAIERHTRFRGPITLRPTVWIIDDRRLLELAVDSSEANPFSGRTDVTYLVGRQR